MAKKLSPIEEAKLRAILADPVEWAKAFVVSNDAASKKYGPWVARDYQAEMLRDKSLKKVYRCGRRCLPEWVRIVDPYSGEWKTVGELFKTKTTNVAAMDEKDYSIKKQHDCPVSYNGVKEVFKVALESGAEIDATFNHPLYTPDGWKEIGELKPGDFVATPAKLDIWGNIELDDDTINSLVNEDYDAVSILDKIFAASKKSTSKFLSKFFSKPHSLHRAENKLYSIELYRSRHKEFIYGLSHLLLRYGIHSVIRKAFDTQSKKDSWILSIKDKESISIFAQEIDVGHIKEAEDFNVGDAFSKRTGEIIWQEIKSIDSIGKYPTYDLTVPEYHNFVANDIITHNTGKSETMIIEGLHKAYTHKNFRILYITPYENQVNLIFMRMREIIHDSPLIKNEVVRMKNSPYMIEFKNGSSIMGFTTGASSGSGAASIRGQRAD